MPTAGFVDIRTQSGYRIAALHTGWVGVKRTHRELDVPAWLAVPSIMLGSKFAPWMPIICYAVVPPSAAAAAADVRSSGISAAPPSAGTVLVDTGPAEDINDPSYYACDPHNEFFYKRNLRFYVRPGETLGPRLGQAQIEPSSVSDLVITHFHADHVGGAHLLPNAQAITGPGNWPNHVGAFTCKLPRGFNPRAAEYTSTAPVPAGSSSVFQELFPATHALTPDGRVRVVPLPGHTPGHCGVALLDGQQTWLMAGDATFDVDQTSRCGVCGVSQDVPLALDTQRRIKQLLERDPHAVLLPAHDPDAFARLQTSGRAVVPK
jgi:N-acyl homoserine lactone hydrolase